QWRYSPRRYLSLLFFGRSDLRLLLVGHGCLRRLFGLAGVLHVVCRWLDLARHEAVNALRPERDELPAGQRVNSALDLVFEVPRDVAPDGLARPFLALLLTLGSQIHVLPCELVGRGVMKRTALIALLMDAVEFCRRGLTTDVLLELRRLSRKLSGRRDRAVADVVDVALPVFGKLPVRKLEQALITAGPGFRIVARLDSGKRLHHLHVDIEQHCCLLDLGPYVIVVWGVRSVADFVWQRHRRPIHRRVGVHDVALRRRLIRLIQQTSIRLECRQLHTWLWLGFGFQRGRPTGYLLLRLPQSKVAARQLGNANCHHHHAKGYKAEHYALYSPVFLGDSLWQW